jgi:hypothetical protein
MSDDNERTMRAQELAGRLRAEGHLEAAVQIENAIGGSPLGAAVLHALRDACQFVLTAIEALDPKTELMAEELRLEVDKRML